MPKTIRCGDRLEEVELRDKRDEAEVDPLYESRVVVNRVAIEVYDTAILALKKPVPMVVTPVISLEKAKSHGSGCGFFGFSQFIGKPKDSVASEFRGWSIDPQTMTRTFKSKVIQMNGLLAPGGLLQVGDSGGPLMCLVDGLWHLLGTSSSRDFQTRSNFMSVADSKFIMDRIGKAQIIPLSSLELSSIEAMHLEAEFSEIKRKLSRLKLDLSGLEATLIKAEGAFEQSSSPSQIRAILLKLEREVIKALLNNSKVALRLKPFSLLQIVGRSDKKSIGDLNYNFFKVNSFDLVSGRAFGVLKTIGPSNFFSCKGELLCGTETIENVSVNISDFDLYSADSSRVFR